eukprot:12602641-Alexandrium_andersonii.AAC.1
MGLAAGCVMRPPRPCRPFCGTPAVDARREVTEGSTLRWPGTLLAKIPLRWMDAATGFDPSCPASA